MFFHKRKTKVVDSPVIVIDALGVSSMIRSSSDNDLLLLATKLDKHFHQFRAAVPFGFVIITPKWVIGTNEFSTFRLNDMFILYSKQPTPDVALRFLVTASLVYHSLLLNGFIPRGGIGFNSVLATKHSIIGAGFIDAYEMAEKRTVETKDICAIQVAQSFLTKMPRTEKVYKLLYFYKGHLFVNPTTLTDPSLGTFDKTRIVECLRTAGTNEAKIRATEQFLEEGEDYDAARSANSRSNEWIRKQGKEQFDSL